MDSFIWKFKLLFDEIFWMLPHRRYFPFNIVKFFRTLILWNSNCTAAFINMSKAFKCPNSGVIIVGRRMPRGTKENKARYLFKGDMSLLLLSSLNIAYRNIWLGNTYYNFCYSVNMLNIRSHVYFTAYNAVLIE